jgi:hypothetical protein
VTAGPIRTITTAMQIYRKGDHAVYGETAITIRVEDESAGWFFVIEDHKGAQIRVDLDELRALLACAEEMAKQEEAK